MQTVNIEAEPRENLTQGKLNSLRKEGWIPAIIYGGEIKKISSKAKSQSQNILLKINAKTFLKTIGDKGTNVVVDLKWGKEKANVVIKEIQRDVVTRQLIHVDFQKISMTEKLEVKVPIHLVGEAPGVKLTGGILEHITRELEISCLPKDIPSVINVDISKLEIGQGVSVKEIPEIPGVQVTSDPNLLVVHVVAQTVVEEAPAATAVPGAAEPEVIAKGKKPEEGEAAAGTAAPAKPGEKAAAPAKGGTPPAGK